MEAKLAYTEKKHDEYLTFTELEVQNKRIKIHISAVENSIRIMQGTYPVLNDRSDNYSSNWKTKEMPYGINWRKWRPNYLTPRNIVNSTRLNCKRCLINLSMSRII